MKRLIDGTRLYTGDHDDFLPLAEKWMDGIDPYVQDDESFRSPAVQNGYGYALNSEWAGKSHNIIFEPDDEYLIFDSTDLSYNATASVDTLPSPPRYGGRNTVAFANWRLQDEDEWPDPLTPYERSRANLRKVALAGLMYAGDYDDGMPLAGVWADAMYPYAKDTEIFRSPAARALDPNAYGYAMNIDVAGISITSVELPAETIGFFDSMVLTKNATEPTSTLPNPPRYPEGNTISFLDGHVGGSPGVN